jgi:diadenylate cyclase
VNPLSYFSINPGFIKFTDMLDILIITCIIYKLASWIKETRAWSLFKGLIVLLIVFAVSSFLGLSTLYFIISNTFNVGLIAAIVLFQPEIRKALEQLGKKNFVYSFIKSEKSDDRIAKRTINEIIKAAKDMAITKTGALIVIEREVPVGDLEQTGIFLDAIISSQLLKNIFVDKTPLHDGAVIIRKNKIKAAACILPLSQNVTEHDFGTRHRAAIGASEISDAYILVVSEERGEISIARNGHLYRNLNEKQLRNTFANINTKYKGKGQNASDDEQKHKA